jgi:hypothetical protein
MFFQSLTFTTFTTFHKKNPDFRIKPGFYKILYDCRKNGFFLNWGYGVFGTKSECRPAILHKSCLKL